ncbi:hypothetical protein DFH09DRAFT_876908, partial [Mycena vulgaris]
MTDYGAQGKSRDPNPVDLNNCNTHMPCYVVFSRGTPAAGTIIIQGFESKKITSGISGYLPQELREIEILDEITRLQFENLLLKHVTGLYHRSIIRTFQLWKGEKYEVQGLHDSIKWQFDMGPRVPDMLAYSRWNATATTKGRPVDTAVKPSNMLKHGLAVNDSLGPSRKKSNVAVFTPRIPRSALKSSVPVGFAWDSQNYSCAYDATFSILCNIWLDNIVVRTAQFKSMSAD